ncbi:MAG: hypothetical protein LAT75_07640 [Candidatus Cyclonatronum sp.]|uniref:RNA polymerase sigma factor n=1 Tax=Cyclonatronum sp. TaxID=3024185 RepID=UPI0025C15DEB|nr:sigma-70 family RNA polymerase sigma factor [Cyclonatronum sp.]MCC5933331.1 sigma-70 family RNA polymerase sigma factor [Balneolales bacterium]MCH8486723.1 hypothetical protein [Cyclonatronum sp.]
MNDFSRFITAIQHDDVAEMNQLARKTTRVITDFLRIHFGVSKDDAEDCAQNVLLMIISKTKTGEIDGTKPAAYILVSARNEYFRLYKQNKRMAGMPSEDLLESTHNNPGQLLIDNELKDLLYLCIEKLNAAFRRMVLFMLSNPEAKTETLAREFNTTASNVWTRKHRINQKLLECIKKNS